MAKRTKSTRKPQTNSVSFFMCDITLGVGGKSNGGKMLSYSRQVLPDGRVIETGRPQNVKPGTSIDEIFAAIVKQARTTK